MGQTLGLPPDHRAGEARLIAFRRVGDLPLYATVARPTPAILARWRETLLLQLAVGLPAWGALVALALLLRRKQRALAAANAGLERRVAERTAALRDSEAQARAALTRLATLVDALPLGVALCDAGGRLLVANEAMLRFVPEVVPSRDEARRSRWRSFHADGSPVDPSDFPAARALRGEPVLPGMEMIHAEDDGRETWTRVLAVHLREESGVTGAVLIVADITAEKAAEERQALLTREVSHRAKNALAVVHTALRLTRRDDADAYARAVEGRVAALGRALSMLATSQWQSASLRELIEGELAAFRPAGGAAGAPGAVTVEGPEVALEADAVQALSMAVHELATNAAKHGALSAPGGRVSVTWHFDRDTGTLTVVWREGGGPALAGTPERRGFGSRLLEATVQGQLGGRVERAWEAEGLVCTMTVPIARAVATGAAAPAG